MGKLVLQFLDLFFMQHKYRRILQWQFRFSENTEQNPVKTSQINCTVSSSNRSDPLRCDSALSLPPRKSLYGLVRPPLSHVRSLGRINRPLQWSKDRSNPLPVPHSRPTFLASKSPCQTIRPSLTIHSLSKSLHAQTTKSNPLSLNEEGEIPNFRRDLVDILTVCDF